MFITIKYGNNESLLCNPCCAVVNLLNSIKRRTGYGNTNVHLDLSDESGLVKELDAHRTDYATKFLQSHETYILVEKQIVHGDYMDEPDGVPQAPPQFNYVPLLDNYVEHFPNYRLHVQRVEKRRARRHHTSKSPSPAGVKGTKTQGKVKAVAQRVPSRRR